MTTPANLTYDDIQTRVANSLRIPVSNTTEMTKLQAIINETYRDVCAKSDWWWLQKRTVVNTAVKAMMSSGTVTNGSTAVSALVADTGSSLATSLTGYVMLVPGDSNDSLAVYRVSAHTAAATSLTLDAAYTGDTSTTGALRFYQDAIPLPVDCGKVLNVKRFGERHPLRREGIETISMLKLSDTSEGKPELYSVFDFVTTGDPTTQRLLQIHPYPDKTYRLEIYYKQNLNTELTGTTRSMIPDDYAQVLIYGALARGYPIVLNDLDRGKHYQALFNDVLALMSAQQREYASDNAQMAPDNVHRGHRRFRRGRRVSLGSYFDRWPSDR